MEGKDTSWKDSNRWSELWFISGSNKVSKIDFSIKSNIDNKWDIKKDSWGLCIEYKDNTEDI